ncbi:MAG: MBL fold metallo-hydrolase [Clostridia bacterium]|nr:MBL fold metallo-hydrolase [Clostridia bacterium]
MDLTVLGNSGPYPAAGSGTSGYLLHTELADILLDCGSGTVRELFRFLDIGDLDAVILSHMHWDHVSDFFMLATAVQFGIMRRELPQDLVIPVYLQEEPAAMFELITHAPAAEHFHFIPVKALDHVRVLNVEITFTPARHPIPTVGMRIEADGKTFYYTGDSNTMEELAQWGKGADAILADCGLPDAVWHPDAPHLSATFCGKLAKDAGARQLLLGHLPPYASEEELLLQAQQVFSGAKLTRTGETYPIGD